MARNKPITGDLMPVDNGVQNLGGPDNYFNKAYIRELVGGAISAGGGGGANKPYSTVVVAASDSESPDAANADFVCTGTGDEVTIQSAIDSITAGEVLLLDGTYYWGVTSVTPKSNISIKGIGKGVTNIIQDNNVVPTDSYFLKNSNINNFSIRDLTFNGNGFAKEALLVDNADADNIYIKNVSYHNHSGSGARFITFFRGTFTNISIINCHTYNTSISGSILIYGYTTTTAVKNIIITNNNFDNGIYISSSNNSVKAERCVIANNILYGGGITLEDSSHFLIENNSIYRTGGRGIQIAPWYQSCEYNIISGNTLTFTGDNYSAYGILLDYGGDVGLSCNYNVIDGNVVVGLHPTNNYPEFAIYVGAHYDGATPNYNVVSNNNVSGSYWSVFNEGSGTLIKGNIFDNPGGFVTESNGNDCSFINNICEGATTNWYGERITITGNKLFNSEYAGMAFNGQNSIIAENYFYNNAGTGSGFSGVDSHHLILHDYPVGGTADDNLVIDNIFRNGTNTAQRCIVVEETTCDNNIIDNNDFRNGYTAAGPIQDNGTGTVIGTNWS